MMLEEHLRTNPETAHALGKHLIPGAHPECKGCTADGASLAKVQDAAETVHGSLKHLVPRDLRERETTRERWDREAREVAQDAADHRIAAGMAKAEQERRSASMASTYLRGPSVPVPPVGAAVGNQFPEPAGTTGTAPRTFTRDEVLTVLETYRALGSTRQRDDVNDLIVIFAAMR